MVEYLLIVLFVVVISFVFLGFNIILRRKSFPETEIGRNREMLKRGIRCPKCDEIRMYRKPKTAVRIDPDKLRIVDLNSPD